jgi:hypothetical protein
MSKPSRPQQPQLLRILLAAKILSKGQDKAKRNAETKTQQRQTIVR